MCIKRLACVSSHGRAIHEDEVGELRDFRAVLNTVL